MDRWQKTYITANLYTLVDNTICDEQLLLYLQSVDIVGKADVEKIKSKLEGLQRSSSLYEIIQTRIGGYAKLSKALFENKQSGAFKILMEGFKGQPIESPLLACGISIQPQNLLSTNIQYQTQNCGITDIFEEFDEEDITDILKVGRHDYDYIDYFVHKGKTFPLVIDTIPPTPSVYIPRYISNRTNLNSALFKEDCNDIFVFKGIDRLKLTSLARPNRTSTSGKQIFELSSRFIYLEDYEDWKDIRQMATVPAHLIKYNSNTNTFILQETVGESKVMTQFTKQQMNEDAYISEQKFIKKVHRYNNAIGNCICDTAGMGKSYLLASLAKQTRETYPTRIVAYFELAQFMENIQTMKRRDNDSHLHLVISLISPTELGKSIIRKAIEKKYTSLELFFDGYDEIPGNKLGLAKSFFQKLLLASKNLKLYFTSRPHHRKDLEATLGVVSYDILPFKWKNQVDLLVNFWKNNIDECDTLKLEQFAEVVLRQLKRTNSNEDRELPTIPLQCHLLAQNNLDNAKRSSHPRRNITISLDQICTPLYSQYKTFFEDKFSAHTRLTMEIRENQAKESVSNVAGNLKKFHVWKALQLLFPELADEYEQYNLLDADIKVLTEMSLSLGILETCSIGVIQTIRFVHRSFAEFLVSEFLAEILFTPQSETIPNFFNNIINFIASTVLGSKTGRDYSYGLTLYRYPTMFPCHRRHSTYELHHPDVTYLLNNHIKELHTFNVATTVANSLTFAIKPSRLYEILQCIMIHGHLHLLTFFTSVFKCTNPSILMDYRNFLLEKSVVLRPPYGICNIEPPAFWLLCLATEYGNLRLIIEYFQFMEVSFQYDLTKSCRNMPCDIKTPLHSSISKLDYELLEFFVDKISLSDRALLYFCVQNSYSDSNRNISKRLDLCNLLLDRNKQLIEEYCYQPLWGKCTSPLLADDVHLELMKFLIQNNTLKSLTGRKANDNVFTFTAKYMLADDYNELVYFLLENVKANDVSPLLYESIHFILKSGPRLEERTMTKILNAISKNLNMEGFSIDSMMISALEGNQPSVIIEELSKHGGKLQVEKSTSPSATISKPLGEMRIQKRIFYEPFSSCEPQHLMSCDEGNSNSLGDGHLKVVKEIVMDGPYLGLANRETKTKGRARNIPRVQFSSGR